MSEPNALPRWLVIDRWTHRQVGDVYADTKPEAERAAQRLGHSLTSHRLVPVLALPTTPRRRRGERMSKRGVIPQSEARAALTQLVNEFTDGTLPDVFRLTPAQRARMLGYIDREYAAIPLGAVVEVEGESGLESWVWNGAEWMSGGERLHVAAVRWRALMLTALYHARRELVDAERALREEACPEANSEDGTRFVCYDENADPIIEADTIADAIRDMARCWARTEGARIRMRDERDAARRELAEKEQQMADALAPFGYEFMDPPDGGDVPFGVQIARMGSALVEARRALAADRKSGERLDASALSDPAPLSGAGNTGETGKPRRWWLVVDRDGYPVYAYSSERLAVEQAQEDNENVPRPAFTPYSVVPVIEARVTRETVEEIAATLTSSLDITPSRSIGRTVARLVAKRIGLTVEE